MVPINDIRGIDSMKYAKGEKVLRCKLAAVYRLIQVQGWTQGIYNHVTVNTKHGAMTILPLLTSGTSQPGH